jgi:AAA+ superfamily predicted ATPase
MRFQRRVRATPPIVLLYGTPGIGKTTQAAAFPGAIVAQFEEGLGAIDVPHTELIGSYRDGLTPIDEALTMTPGTYVTDSLDHLEPHI